MRKALFGLLLAISVAHVFAQDADKTLAAALRKQADAWDVAIVKKDKKAIADNMSESFFMIDSSGETSDKAKFVADLTAPDITKLGVEMFAICSKVDSKADNSPSKKQAREAAFSGKFEQLSKRYMDELRRAALIEYR